MESLKGTESIFMIILSLLSRMIDIPNYCELVSDSQKKKSSEKDVEKDSPDNSSLVRRNVLFDITSAAKTMFQSNADLHTVDSEVIFGKLLDKELPRKLKKLFIFLKKSVHCEGIFRKCGSTKRIKDIKKLLNSHGNVIDWEEQEEFTVHDAASVLKQYIAELPESPLLTKYIPIHVEISKLAAGKNKLKSIQLILLLLPEENRMFLKMVMVLLREVAQNPNSLMDSHNLGLIFAPHFLKSSEMDTATNLCIGNATTSDQLDDLVSYTAYLIDNSDQLFRVPAELETTAERFSTRLRRGESTEEIPLEIESRCVKMGEDLHKDVVNSQTKLHLLGLYNQFQLMPEGKEKASRMKKFEKEYPHYIMELNNVSHSPLIRTKTKRMHIGNSLSKLLSVKTPSSAKKPDSPLSQYLTSTPAKSDCAVSTNGGTKRKALEMLETSPTKFTSLSSFIGNFRAKHSHKHTSEDVSGSMDHCSHDHATSNAVHQSHSSHDHSTSYSQQQSTSEENPIEMETDPHDGPRIVRRRLQDHLCDVSNVSVTDQIHYDNHHGNHLENRHDNHHGHGHHLDNHHGNVSSDDAGIPMEYRQVGESYREYYV